MVLIHAPHSHCSVAFPSRNAEMYRFRRKFLILHLLPEEKNLRMFFDKSGIFSYRTALRNCVDAETLLVVLQEYYNAIPGNAKLLSGYAESGDLEHYTVLVHSLKNAAKMIGALELAEKAYRLEQAGEERRTDEIKEQTPALLDVYLETRDVLKPLLEEG